MAHVSPLLLRAFAPAGSFSDARGVGYRQWRLLRGEKVEQSDEGTGILRQEVDASHFDVEGVIGEGNYSQIYKAKLKSSQQPIALKMIDKEKAKRYKKEDEILVERWVLQNCKHPSVIQMHHAFQEVGALYLALELVPGGELWAKTHRCGSPMSLARFYAAQLLEVLQFFHERDVVHRDVKPENVLLTTDGHIKVIDFGTAKLLRKPFKLLTEKEAEENAKRAANGEKPVKDRRTAHKDFVGTPEYMPPEAINNKHTDQRGDLWSFGCFIAMIITGWPHFKGGSDYLTFKRVLARKYILPDGMGDAADLIEKLCQIEPKERLGGKWSEEAEAADPSKLVGTAPRTLGGHEEIRRHPFFASHYPGRELWKAPVPELPQLELDLIDFHMEVGKSQSAEAKKVGVDKVSSYAWRGALGATLAEQQATLDSWSAEKKRSISLELWKLNLLDADARRSLGLGPAPEPISDEALLAEDLNSGSDLKQDVEEEMEEEEDNADDVDEDEDHEAAKLREEQEDKEMAAAAARRRVLPKEDDDALGGGGVVV